MAVDSSWCQWCLFRALKVGPQHVIMHLGISGGASLCAGVRPMGALPLKATDDVRRLDSLSSQGDLVLTSGTI